MIQARTVVFDGDCGRLAILQPDCVVFRRSEIPCDLQACTRPIHTNDGVLVTRALEAG